MVMCSRYIHFQGAPTCWTSRSDPGRRAMVGASHRRYLEFQDNLRIYLSSQIVVVQVQMNRSERNQTIFYRVSSLRWMQHSTTFKFFESETRTKYDLLTHDSDAQVSTRVILFCYCYGARALCVKPSISRKVCQIGLQNR
jgi:hypothetical protein